MDNTVPPGSPGYVAPESYRPIVAAQVALIDAFLATLAATPGTPAAPLSVDSRP